jgi:hypothetical protein
MTATPDFRVAFIPCHIWAVGYSRGIVAARDVSIVAALPSDIAGGQPQSMLLAVRRGLTYCTAVRRMSITITTT